MGTGVVAITSWCFFEPAQLPDRILTVMFDAVLGTLDPRKFGGEGGAGWLGMGGVGAVAQWRWPWGFLSVGPAHLRGVVFFVSLYILDARVVF